MGQFERLAGRDAIAQFIFLYLLGWYFETQCDIGLSEVSRDANSFQLLSNIYIDRVRHINSLFSYFNENIPFFKRINWLLLSEEVVFIDPSIDA